jgi:magnesium transporter
LAEDVSLAEIIAELATDARLEVQADIPRFLAARNITSLFHFTSIKNLESIVTHGFLGRRISAWVALASGPTMIAGIYGMNFHHMPELSTKYGYFVIVGVMVSLTAFLVRKFRKSGWL